MRRLIAEIKQMGGGFCEHIALVCCICLSHFSQSINQSTRVFLQQLLHIRAILSDYWFCCLLMMSLSPSPLPPFKISFLTYYGVFFSIRTFLNTLESIPAQSSLSTIFQQAEWVLSFNPAMHLWHIPTHFTPNVFLAQIQRTSPATCSCLA